MQLPPGIVASTAAVNQGHKPDVFDKPEARQPERWLDDNLTLSIAWRTSGMAGTDLLKLDVAAGVVDLSPVAHLDASRTLANR